MSATTTTARLTPAPPPASGGHDYRSASEAVLAVMVGLGVLVGAWPVMLAITGPGPLMLTPVLAHVAGMLAGYGVLVLMVLMSRWPVLERGVGSDRIARWHSVGGRVVLTLVLVHAWAATAAWAGSRNEGMLVALWHVLGLPWLISAAVATVVLTVVAVVSVRAARRRISYEAWHATHLSVYVAIALSFLHQLGGPDLAGYTLLQVGWALMYTHAFGLVLRYRVLGPFREAARHRLRVDQVVQETPGVVSIVLSGSHLDELRAEPGQFFRWRFLTPDTWLTAHPFSLSAPPRSDRLRLTVKALGDGSRLLQSIEVGTWVVAEGPYGSMTAARRTKRDVLLVAGGVGITPMRALFETIPKGPGQDVMLLYRARSREHLVFRQELNAIAESRRARVVYLLGESSEHLSSDSLTRLVPGLTDRDVYLCGPPGMAEAVRRSLRQAGLRSSQLHEERFAF
jgi:predicted ferric reductase